MLTEVELSCLLRDMIPFGVWIGFSSVFFCWMVFFVSEFRRVIVLNSELTVIILRCKLGISSHCECLTFALVVLFGSVT